MAEHKAYFYDYPIGKVGIAEKDGQISGVFFEHQTPADFVTVETEIIKKASVQLSEYFEKKRTMFELPLFLQGTSFNLRVLNALLAVPYGETRSYMEIAKSAGSPNAARAVGTACKNNPIAIIIPCHRIIGANGELTGYAGGLNIKRYLLDMETNTERNARLLFT